MPLKLFITNYNDDDNDDDDDEWCWWSDTGVIGVDLTGILGGAHGGTYYKSPAVDAKKHIFLHCNASNWCLKLCNRPKSGETISCTPNSGGILSPLALRDLRPWLECREDKLSVNPNYSKSVLYVLRALMQLPSASRLRLMCAPSTILLPRFWVLAARSEPARSMRNSLPTRSCWWMPVTRWRCLTDTISTAWDRDDVLFAAVGSCVLCLLPPLRIAITSTPWHHHSVTQQLAVLLWKYLSVSRNSLLTELRHPDLTLGAF